MGIETISPAYAQPIDLAEARLHLKLDGTEDDALVRGNIQAVTAGALHLTSHVLVATRVRETLPRFPAGVIKLSLRPLLEFEAVTYVDQSGEVQALADTQVQRGEEFVRLAPAAGSAWPATLVGQLEAVSVTYRVGHAAPIAVDAAANTVRPLGWRTLAVGDIVRFSNSGGALPAPLQPDTDYFVKTVDGAGACTLAATSGGAELDLTTVGSGTSFIGAVPEAVKAWMKLRLGALAEHREESAAKLEPLPHADRLLDPFKAYG